MFKRKTNGTKAVAKKVINPITGLANFSPKIMDNVKITSCLSPLMSLRSFAFSANKYIIIIPNVYLIGKENKFSLPETRKYPVNTEIREALTISNED